MDALPLYAQYYATISKAKANPNKVLDDANGEAVAVLSNSDLRYYMVPPKLFENMASILGQMETSKNRNHVAGQFQPSAERLDEMAADMRTAFLEDNAAEGDFAEVDLEAIGIKQETIKINKNSL